MTAVMRALFVACVFIATPSIASDDSNALELLSQVDIQGETLGSKRADVISRWPNGKLVSFGKKLLVGEKKVSETDPQFWRFSFTSSREEAITREIANYQWLGPVDSIEGIQAMLIAKYGDPSVRRSSYIAWEIEPDTKLKAKFKKDKGDWRVYLSLSTQYFALEEKRKAREREAQQQGTKQARELKL